MQTHIKILLACTLLFVLTKTIFSQKEFTTYDEFPGIIKSYKPAYLEDYPNWAKMLYQDSVNYFEMLHEYENCNVKMLPEFSPIHRYFKIWKRQIAQWVKEDGSIHLMDKSNYDRNLNSTQLNASRLLKSEDRTMDKWRFLGPRETYWLNENGSEEIPSACPWQVNVYSFDVSESNPEILYCGTETGFVNKTTNKGKNWELLSPEYYFGGAVTAVIVHPNNPEISYVASGNQVHKTQDGGITWSPLLDLQQLFHADRLKFDPSDPERIYAAADSGLYYSKNGGVSWVKVWNQRVYDIEINPANHNKVWALSSNGDNFQLIYSENRGSGFAVDSTFPTGIFNQSGGLLAVSPADTSMVLAVMLSSDNTPVLYKFDSIENTWTLLATGQSDNFPMNNGQGYFDLVLEISPTDPDIIFAGTTSLFKSENGGETFVIIGGYGGAFAIHPDIQDLKLLANGESWVSTDGGFTFSTDVFTNTENYFARNNGLVGSDMWGFDQGWNEDLLVGGRYHNGNTAVSELYGDKALRMGGAESPTGWVLQGKSRHVAFNDLGNGWILPKSAEGQPSGRFIFSKYPNMDEYGGRRGNLVFHPNYYGTIYLGEGNGLWKSEDLGLNFNLIFDFGSKVRYLQISYSNPEVIYADIIGKGLMRSDDGGINWALKPSLTNGQNGTSYWNGKLFFAISPTDENKIYACLQNGTWSADKGKVFRSENGGDSWEEWTAGLSEYTKCLVVQTDSLGNDLVYLFSNARNGEQASVFQRHADDNEWMEYNAAYPAGMNVNMALPFFRDGKLRIGGNAGIWEVELQQSEFHPIINPWIEKPHYDCLLDTLFFDDHSILNHENASWNWLITPEPVFIDDPNIRNPKVVLGNAGSYDVTMTITKNGISYFKQIKDMVSTTSCPSIDDCNNPGKLPKDLWSLMYADSEEVNYPGLATMSFDDDPSTIWHTSWSTGSDPYPHEIQIDLGANYNLFEFTLLNRQNGSNGRIKEYEIYLSRDTEEWGEPIKKGVWENTGSPQTIIFDQEVQGQYFKLLGLSEVNGNAWSSVAEFDFLGCETNSTRNSDDKYIDELYAFPVPTNGIISIPLPDSGEFLYSCMSITGKIVTEAAVKSDSGLFTLDLSGEISGVYVVILRNNSGRIFRVKIIKN